MNDPRHFKAPFIPKERIRQEADRLRAAYPAGRSLPVEILDLAEFDLGLDLVPLDGLREQLDIDALLMGDLKSILLDKRSFMSPRLEYRYLVKAMTEGWVAAWKKKGWWRTNKERPENVDLWQRLDPLCETHQVEFRWIRGHAGNRENERCDQIAMTALHRPDLPADDGYENKPETDAVRPEMREGDSCYKCSTPVIKRKGKWKPSHDYYYDYHLWCPKCQIAYHIESAKRFVEQPPSLF